MRSANEVANCIEAREVRNEVVAAAAASSHYCAFSMNEAAFTVAKEAVLAAPAGTPVCLFFDFDENLT